jgi:hypothetical protein
MILKWGLLLLVGVVVFAASPASASRVDHGYSGNGSLESFIQCEGTDLPDGANCEGFQSDTFTFGSTSVAGFDFAAGTSTTTVGDTCSNSALSDCIDVFQLTIVPGEVLTLDLQNPSQPFGLFECSTVTGDLNSVVDSSDPPNPLTGLPCTPVANDSGSLIQGTNGVFTFTNSPSEPTEWTFYSDGNLDGISSQSSVTPEPSTCWLLGTGLLGILALVRRRATSTRWSSSVGS